MTTITNQINIERGDSFYGTVIKETHSGAIIDIGSGITGFAYTSLKLNDKCLCSVRKIKENTGFIILNIDSVVFPDVAA